MNYIFGYGSLLSAYSRQRYSGIHSEVMSATVKGWVRGWCVTYPDEGATYAGAVQDDSRELDGVLIASDIDEEIAERERGYRFTQLDIDQIDLANLGQSLSNQDQVWICETLISDVSTLSNPLPQSYVDTCLSGCIESNGIEAARRFIHQTRGWDCVWINDRDTAGEPIYPRYTPISDQESQLIDQLLDDHGVLQFRNRTTTI